MCLIVDTCLTADSGVASLIPARSHTFVEIDHKIISMAILLPSADSRRVVVSYKQNYEQEVLVNRFNSQACPGKSVVRWTDHPNMTIADLGVRDVKNQTKKKNKNTESNGKSQNQIINYIQLQNHYVRMKQWPIQ